MLRCHATLLVLAYFACVYQGYPLQDSSHEQGIVSLVEVSPRPTLISVAASGRSSPVAALSSLLIALHPFAQNQALASKRYHYVVPNHRYCSHTMPKVRSSLSKLHMFQKRFTKDKSGVTKHTTPRKSLCQPRLPKEHRFTVGFFRVFSICKHISLVFARLCMLLAFFVFARQPVVALSDPIPVNTIQWSGLIARRSTLAACGSLFLAACIFSSVKTAINILFSYKLAFSQSEYNNDNTKEPVDRGVSDAAVAAQAARSGETICMLTSAALLAEVAVRLYGRKGAFYSAFISILATIIFVEALPKAIASAKPKLVLHLLMPIVRIVSLLLLPHSRLSSIATRFFQRFFDKDETETTVMLTSTEIRELLENRQPNPDNSIHDLEQDMMEGALDMNRRQVSSIMTPRIDIEFLEKDSTLFDLPSKSKFSRIPLCDGGVDKIVGIIKTRRLIDLYHDALKRLDNSSSQSIDWSMLVNLKNAPVESIMEDTKDIFVPETMTVLNALRQMQRLRLHMLIVVDQYGGNSGLVTLEDILEIIVGEIYDEDDIEEAIQDDTLIVQVEPGIYQVDAGTDLKEIAERFALERYIDWKTFESFKTISGYLCQLAGEIPLEGNIFHIGHAHFVVQEASDKRIMRLRVSNVTDTEDE